MTTTLLFTVVGLFVIVSIMTHYFVVHRRGLFVIVSIMTHYFVVHRHGAVCNCQDNDPLLSCSPNRGALSERDTVGGFPVKFLILVVSKIIISCLINTSFNATAEHQRVLLMIYMHLFLLLGELIKIIHNDLTTFCIHIYSSYSVWK